MTSLATATRRNALNGTEERRIGTEIVIENEIGTERIEMIGIVEMKEMVGETVIGGETMIINTTLATKNTIASAARWRSLRGRYIGNAINERDLGS